MKASFYLIIFAFSLQCGAQFRHQPSSSEIRLKLQKLNTLGTVLYIAAHPDDENTLAIGYYANERLMTTAYLSLTRGDGGQNLIGGELRDKLGLIRTQELLAARRVDGGIQFFTRANDFGFSKGPEETLRIWDKNEILHDVLKVIRSFKPDIIICRFPPDARAGHGHHTSSALLALEAFDKAADPSIFPEQVAQYGTWKPRRIFLNVSRFFNPNINESSPNVITIDMGGFNPYLGVSYPELSATSRSMHKSQGFGSRARRGYTPEFFELQRGDTVRNDLLEKINTTWSRIPEAKGIELQINNTLKKFKDDQPWLIIPDLLAIGKSIEKLKSDHWKERKLQEVNNLIRDCLGLYMEVTSDHYYQSPGNRIQLNIEVQNRSLIDVKLIRISFPELNADSLLTQAINKNQQVMYSIRKMIPDQIPFSPPYWLKEKHGIGLFTVNQPELIGQPENLPALSGIFTLEVGGQLMEFTVPVLYKNTDPVRGEVYRPVEITPPVSIVVRQSSEIFTSSASKKIRFDVRSLAALAQQGKIQFKSSSGWKIFPEAFDLNLEKRGSSATYEIEVFPPASSGEGLLTIVADINGKSYQSSIDELAYDHIPNQTLQPPSEIRLVRSDIQSFAKKIAYVQGAGDDVAASIRSLGIEVSELKESDITAEDLKSFDAVVLGIRALNANSNIKNMMPELLKYCEQGGVLISQYNTNGDLATDRFSPFSLTISRERVTEENAEVRILDPAHPVMRIPNLITTKDFDGWVQERGIYFPGTWDSAFSPLLSMNDKGEPERKGGLLVAPYGSGYYVYTGLSFFRQLPEGVPGAYRLFANLISLKNSSKSKQ